MPYADLLKRWQNHNPDNLAELLEVISGLREAARRDGANQDVGFWLAKTDPESVPEHLRRLAIYETLIASMRARGTMDGYEAIVREYYADVPQLVRMSDLDDSAVLLGFCLGASRLNALAIGSDDLRLYSTQILDRIDELLSGTNIAGYRAQLLFTRGLAAAMASPNLDGVVKALSDWEEALGYVASSKLFPATDLNTLISQMFELLPESVSANVYPRLLRISDKLDAIIAERYGAFAVAAKCRDRAMILYKQGDLLKAILQFIRARRNWFAEETLQGSILATMFLSRCYRELGLAFAGKHYALNAALMAAVATDLSLRRFVPQSLFMAADCDYTIGAWCNFMLLANEGLRSAGQFSVSLDYSDEESDVFRTLFHSGIIHSMAAHFAPSLRAALREVIQSWNLTDDLDHVLDTADQQWADAELEDVLSALRDECIFRPFSDASPERCTRFCALGIEWEVTWENSYATTLVAEQFVAMLQALLADLAGTELCLVPKAVSLLVRLDETQPAHALAEGEDVGEWVVTLPDPKNKEDFQISVLTASTGLLICCSSLPMDKVNELLSPEKRNGLFADIGASESATRALALFVSEEAFAGMERATQLASLTDHEEVFEHNQLSVPSGPGPGYARKEHEIHIGNRYKVLTKKLELIWPDLSNRSAFRAIALELRQSGWKDWHILLATCNLLINHVARIRCEQMAESPSQFLTEQLSLASGLEVLPNEIEIPDEILTVADLEKHLNISMIATLRGWGLVSNTQRVNTDGIVRLLSNRYGYWDDDIEHDDIGI